MVEAWIILTLFSALTFGIKDVLAKKILNEKIKPNQLIFLEYFVLFLGVLLIRFQKINFLTFLDTYYLFLLKTISLFCFSFIFFKLLEKHDVSLISPLTNLSPVFLINIHHHKQKKPHNYHLKKLKKLNWKTISLVILMLFSISITGISDKFIFNIGINVDTNIFWTSCLILIFVVIQIVFSNQKQLIKKSFTLENFILSIFTNISTILILMAIVIPMANISLIVPIKRTSTLFASIFGGLLFHEKHIIKKIIATVGMLIGVILIAL